MITIRFLADHLEVIPTLSNWSEADFEQDFLEDASRNRLPIRLLAYESGELVGTIVLRENGSETTPDVQPELGGLYVIESHRTHGIGTALIQAGMNLARNQGYEAVSATTIVAAGILQRLGWQFVKTVIHEDGQLSLYRCKL